MKTADFEALCAACGYPPEAVSDLSRDYARLEANGRCMRILEKACALYEADEKSFDLLTVSSFVGEARASGVHPFASEFIFYTAMLPLLERKYAEKAIPSCCYKGAVEDLLCKLNECCAVYGIRGTFVGVWFSRFFRLSLYTFGRLEFCLIPCPFDHEKEGRRIFTGDPCIDVHIPSKGPILRADLDDSYARAAAFFAPRLGNAPTVFHCQSWLLADYHRQMLPENSGILTFCRDYDLVAKAEDEGDLWRIFGSKAGLAPKELPGDTLLQRAYRERLEKGLPVYGGTGLYFYR